MKRAMRFLPAAVCACLAPGIANAEAFRGGQPDTLEAPRAHLESSLDAAPWTALREALARHGAPRFALSWNVALSDEIADVRRRSRVEEENTEGEHYEHEESAAEETATRFTEGGHRGQRRQVQTDETRRIGHDTRDADTRDADWAMEPTFAAELARGGVRFVDKRIATRLGALDQRTDDFQSAEMAGLERYADFLVEVTIQRTPEAPLGRTFRVTVTGTADGSRLVDFLTDGTVRFRGHLPYVATANGFQRAPAPRATPEQAVRQLAVDTAGHLLRALP